MSDTPERCVDDLNRPASCVDGHASLPRKGFAPALCSRCGQVALACRRGPCG